MKKQTIITSSIIVVLIILGGLVYWSLNKNHTFYNNENINENVNIDNVSTDTDTSNWVTFEDKKLGFKFNHPKTWMIDQKRVNYGTNEANEISFYITINPDNPSTGNHLTKITITTFENIEGKKPEEVVAMKEGFSFDELQSLFLKNLALDEKIVGSYTIPGFVSLPGLIFYNNNKVHQITYDLNQNTFDAIIKTFRFTD